MSQLEDFIDANPKEALELLRRLQAKRLKPHSEGQREVLTSNVRFNVLNAGRRWGKTKVGAAVALRHCRKPKNIVWWVAPIYKNVKRGYEEVLAQLPSDVLAKPAPPVGMLEAGRSPILHFKNGAQMHFYSAERAEGMLGGSCDFLIFDEAATVKEDVWNQVIRATLADRQGGALFISTPRGKNWFYRLWVRGQDELDTEYKSWTFPSYTNPTIPKSEFDAMAESLPAAIYEQEILADFISKSASVFRFDDSAVVPIEIPRGHVTIGIDLAKVNDFTVIHAVNNGNRRPCWHDRFNSVSWPEQRRRILEAVDAIMETAESVTVLADQTGVGDVVIDDLFMDGLDVVGIKFSQQWKQMAVMLLAADLERGAAFIHDEQVKEFESYSYKIAESGRWKYEAASGHDDEVSAVLICHWGVVNSGVPDVQMISASENDETSEQDFDYVDAEGEEILELPAAPSPTELLKGGIDHWL